MRFFLDRNAWKQVVSLGNELGRTETSLKMPKHVSKAQFRRSLKVWNLAVVM